MSDHFAFPFRFGAAGRANVVEQDSPEEIEQGVKVLLLTELGERVEVPDFGVEEGTFRTALDLDAYAEAATEWDERASVLFTEQRGKMSEMIRHLLVQVARREED